MQLLMAFIIFLYVIAVTVVIRRIIRRLGEKEEQEILALKEYCDNLLEKKVSLTAQRQQLEKEASEMFTLYDLAREITKNFSEEDAFHAFKTKLREKVAFAECRLIHPMSLEIDEWKKQEGHALFPLEERGKLLGYLATSGTKREDQEKIMILVRQLVLGLRRIRLYQQIEQLAITDSLTEVHTRRYILERLEEELLRASTRQMQLGFLMIDVDHFKRLNDSHGHITGDQILREIGRIIKENTREIDIVGRYGGEEFCMILPDTDEKGAGYVAERIRAAAERTRIKAYDATVQATLSIGIAGFPKDGKTSQELLDKADWALYRAKKRGRNRVVVFGMDDDAAHDQPE